VPRGHFQPELVTAFNDTSMADDFVNTRLSDKVGWSLPWLARYPFWRANQLLRNGASVGPQHLIFVVANHFEPGLGDEALRRLDKWCELARSTGDVIRDHDGTPFRHTNFFPAEQYERPLLQRLAELQASGYGEVEIHLHHGVDQPDTAKNTRDALITFRDLLAEEHKCLSREHVSAMPKYGFVHGNWALANSAGGRFCGVDSEMQILAETGCYGDFTLPSVPFQSQVPRINAIYECGNPLTEARPHRSGPSVRVGKAMGSPIIFNGPLVFDWTRRVRGLPVPRLEDGALAANYPLNLNRLKGWRSAGIGVEGRPDWVFIKLYCHGFFEHDQDVMIGEQLKRFMGNVLELSERTGEFKIHFATAREAFNMVVAAVEGRSEAPGRYRDYRLRQIMREPSSALREVENEKELVGLVG
jgi:hypothetical protein